LESHCRVELLKLRPASYADLLPDGWGVIETTHPTPL
jgi:hypothetical protein